MVLGVGRVKASGEVVIETAVNGARTNKPIEALITCLRTSPSVGGEAWPD